MHDSRHFTLKKPLELPAEDLNNFSLNKKIIRTQQEFFHKDQNNYWKVFLEYESIHENQPDSNSFLRQFSE